MSDNQIRPYPLRLDPNTRKQLEAIAKDNGRSLNTEMAMRLKDSLATVKQDRVLTEKDVQKIALEVFKTLR